MVKPFREQIGKTIKFNVPSTFLCPCGSKKKIGDCCYTPAGLVKKPAKLLPPRPATGLSHKDCYAAHLSDCNEKLSREHFISKALLTEIDRTGGLLIHGYAWQQEGSISRVSPDSLASKILCGRHHAALSPLDQAGGMLFRALYDSHLSGQSLQKVHLFNGLDIERWLLKVLCGLTIVNNFGSKHGAKDEILAPWIDILFGYADFPGDCGLYFCREVGNIFAGPVGVMWKAIIDGGQIAGLGAVMCGYEFILSLNGFPERQFDSRAFVHRPHEIFIRGKDYGKSILFSWPGEADLGTIVIERD